MHYSVPQSSKLNPIEVEILFWRWVLREQKRLERKAGRKELQGLEVPFLKIINFQTTNNE